MKGVSTKLILVLVGAVLFIGFITILATKAVKNASVVGASDIGVKFREDGFIMTSKKDLVLSNIKVYMKRFEIEQEVVEVLDGSLDQFNVFQYTYPHNDVELVIIYYYGPDEDGKDKWTPYHLHNYEFE